VCELRGRKEGRISWITIPFTQIQSDGVYRHKFCFCHQIFWLFLTHRKYIEK
jgi:hypothetical protein